MPSCEVCFSLSDNFIISRLLLVYISCIVISPSLENKVLFHFFTDLTHFFSIQIPNNLIPNWNTKVHKCLHHTSKYHMVSLLNLQLWSISTRTEISFIYINSFSFSSAWCLAYLSKDISYHILAVYFLYKTSLLSCFLLMQRNLICNFHPIKCVKEIIHILMVLNSKPQPVPSC